MQNAPFLMVVKVLHIPLSITCTNILVMSKKSLSAWKFFTKDINLIWKKLSFYFMVWKGVPFFGVKWFIFILLLLLLWLFSFFLRFYYIFFLKSWLIIRSPDFWRNSFKSFWKELKFSRLRDWFSQAFVPIHLWAK